MSLYNSGRYCGIVNALRQSPYSQEFVEGFNFPGNIQGIVTENLSLFIATENNAIITTEG